MLTGDLFLIPDWHRVQGSKSNIKLLIFGVLTLLIFGVLLILKYGTGFDTAKSL
jgi:hypothetical protein